MKKEKYDKLPPLMKRDLKKYGPIVKKYYDEFDPIKVFPSAPDNHYDLEVDHIALEIDRCKSFLDVSKLIYITTCFYFGIWEISESDCLTPAKKMFDEIKK